MMSPRRALLLAFLAVPVLGACGPTDADVAPAETSAIGSAAPDASLDGAAMLAYLESTIDVADSKFMQMAEAVPDEAWDWRPMEGVRSFREVFIHVAADNWFGGALMGQSVPDDVGITADPASIGAYQDRVLDRAATLTELRRSFDFFGQTLDATRGELARTATLGGRERTYGELWVALVTHMHEHLGQSVAYARANDIVPPWSR
jgi:uncharacterized damage-inducible protein DinB